MKVNIEPSSLLRRTTSEASDTKTKKSEATPVVGPSASLTEIEQRTIFNARNGVPYSHTCVLLAVGYPKTAKEGKPPPITASLDTETSMANLVVVATGTVENEYVNPPSIDIGTETGDVADGIKSDGVAVVGPSSSDTLMVQVTGSPTRDGFVFKHKRVEDVVGLPNTVKL